MHIAHILNLKSLGLMVSEIWSMFSWILEIAISLISLISIINKVKFWLYCLLHILAWYFSTIFDRNLTKEKTIAIFKIFKILKMAAILNFIVQFFWKTNQVWRRPLWTSIPSFMSIHQAVLEIERSQEISTHRLA